MELPSLLKIAEKLALSAGKIVNRKSQQPHRETYQLKANNDFVTQVDIAVNKHIVEHLSKTCPEHGILSEELAYQGKQSADYQWVIDPIDGTTNFIFGIPHYAVSIGLIHKHEPVLGVIYDPIKNELFTARQGGGAYLNDQRIRVSKHQILEGALLGTGIPYHSSDPIDSYLDLLRSLIEGTSGIRRLGAASLDLAYVACGRLDGFWELGLRLWDITAGVVIAREAGALITDLQGQRRYLESGNILAATPAIHKAMLKRIKD